MKTALYYRVSSDEQTTACQKPEVESLVAARSLSVVKTYDETGSAAKARPQFEQMLADAKAGHFKVLVIWALDRFGRSMAGNINDVLALDRLGIKVISVREPWMDTAGPVRELLIAIFSWCAQQERARLIERTKAGLVVARAKGKKLGRPSERMASDPAAVVAAWRGTGQTYAKLAKQLGGVSTSTAHRLARQ